MTATDPTQHLSALAEAGSSRAGRVVEIYTLVPPKLTWQDLPVDLIAGLEEGLIRRLRPRWNRRSNREEA